MSSSFQAPMGALTNLSGSMRRRAPSLSSYTITRPANTTAYAAGDAVYAAVPGSGSQILAMPFANVASDLGNSAIIVSALLIDSAAEATRLGATLLLFSDELTTAPVDNAAFTLASADVSKFLGAIEFPVGSAKDLGAGATYYEAAPYLVVQPQSDSQAIYGVLIANNAYTPVSGEKLTVRLGVMPRDTSLI